MSDPKETEQAVISYSPRRLAVGYYCGALAAHSRTDGGQPETPGLIYGNFIDKAIAMFFMTGAHLSPESQGYGELEYTIYNTPPVKQGERVSSTSVRGTYTINGKEFVVGGKTDLTFDELVIEVKTGVDKEWHLIQALSYATILQRPCRILYVTRKHHKTVEPNVDELKRIIWEAYLNEQARSESKCEHCATCPIRKGCSVWSQYSPLARTLVGLQECKSLPDISDKDKKELEMLYKKLRPLATTYLDNDCTYRVDRGSVTITNGKLYVRSNPDKDD